LNGPLHSNWTSLPKFVNQQVTSTNEITKEVFGRNFERHQDLSFGDQVCNQLGKTLEDCVKHQKIHFQIG
jgi:hypothetical protein